MNYLRLLGAALVFGGCLHSPVWAGALQVGVGKVAVTPPPEVFPYAPSDTPSLNLQSGERSFVGVHDDVYARALVMDDGVQKVALVVLEVTAVPRADDMVRAVARQIGVSESHVMLAATHTHSVPLYSYSGATPSVREQREIQRLTDGAVAAARQANAHMQPANIAFGRGEAWVNINNGEQAGLKSGFDSHGPSDKTLDVVRFSTPAGAPIAMLVNYASHAEVMFRSVTKDNGYEVSGDLPGAVSSLLEAHAGAAPVVLFTAAAEADQLTLFKSLQYADAMPAADEGAGGWALLNVQARRVAGSVMNTLAGMPRGTDQVHIDAAAGTAVCPGQQLSIDAKTNKITVTPKPPVTIPLSMIKINDIVFGGVGGDVASEIGRQFKKASPASHSMLVTLAGESVGYIFADASYAKPGHGVTKSLLAPHCAERAVVDGLVKMIGAAAQPGSK